MVWITFVKDEEHLVKHFLEGAFLYLTSRARITTEQEPLWKTYFTLIAIRNSTGLHWNYERRTYDTPTAVLEQELDESIPDEAPTANTESATARQDKIRWHNIMEGFPAKGWADEQQQWYDWKKSRRTGKRWTTALVKKLAETVWAMWDHRNTVKETNTETTEIRDVTDSSTKEED